MEEKQEKEKGNFWLTVASFIVNKRKAIEILFVLAMIYSVLSINKVQVNQDITWLNSVFQWKIPCAYK